MCLWKTAKREAGCGVLARKVRVLIAVVAVVVLLLGFGAACATA